MTRLQLQVRAPTVMHEVTIQQLQRWLDGASISSWSVRGGLLVDRASS
jgi:hypothetical protein